MEVNNSKVAAGGGQVSIPWIFFDCANKLFNFLNLIFFHLKRKLSLTIYQRKN